MLLVHMQTLSACHLAMVMAMADGQCRNVTLASIKILQYLFLKIQTVPYLHYSCTFLHTTNLQDIVNIMRYMMSGLFLFVHVNEWAPSASTDTIPISMGYILAELKARGFDGTILGYYKDRPLDGYEFRPTIQKLQPACSASTPTRKILTGYDSGPDSPGHWDTSMSLFS